MANEPSDGGDDGLHDAQKKRIEELQKRQAAEQQLKAIVNKLFEPAAIERLANIRISNPDLYLNLVQAFVSMYQNGQLKGKVTEAQLKQVASGYLSQRRETTIKRI